ncbi:MAG: type II toxin-antitoxin system RelE/ParE family toxin [Candidatus Saliniplasma sp.]
MSYEVLLHPRAYEFLKKAEDEVESRIRDKLKSLSDDPKSGEKLKHSEFWLQRIADHRAIYEINHKDQQVIILFIGHRNDVYDDFSRLV